MIHEGEKLKEFMSYKGISAIDLAQLLDVRRSTIYAYQRTKSFHEETRSALRDAIGFDVSNYSSQDAALRDSKTSIRTKQQTGRYKHTPRNKGVPVYDVELTATAVESMENYTALEPEYYLDIPFFRDCDFAGKVVGDSMYPKYRHGSIIVCKRITAWQKFFEAGRAYLVITRTDNFRAVKYLQEDDTDNDYLWLLSHNAESFPPQRIPKDEILELYLVKGQIDQ